MRPYRGKRKDNGEWVYGSLRVCNAYDLNDGIHKPEPLHAIICKRDIEWVNDPDNKRWAFLSYEVIPSTVGQSTGLHDKNGKEIYEGDIVRGIWQVDHKTAVVGTVKYWENFGLYGLDDKAALISIVWKGCEIIGTIHDKETSNQGPEPARQGVGPADSD